MKRTYINLSCIIPIIIFTACFEKSPTSESPDPTVNTGVKLVARRVSDLASGLPKTRAEVSVDVTPAIYKLALIDFWLVDSVTGQDISVINPDTLNPTYTESSPCIIDLATDTASQELFSDTTFPSGTYTGYKMHFLYVEMSLPVVFHVPNESWETEFTDSTILDTVINRHFRLYFNVIDKYWKRDFVVELEYGTGIWYWLRREVENNAGIKNFFIAVDSNTHPISDAGPNSTIDLFHDEAFWGPDSLYDDPSNPIIVGTHSTTGGLDCRWEENITIPAAPDSMFALDLEIDVTNTMNFWESDSGIPSSVVFVEDTLDLGPGYSGQLYGDKGLHPLMPKFRVSEHAAK